MLRGHPTQRRDELHGRSLPTEPCGTSRRLALLPSLAVSHLADPDAALHPEKALRIDRAREAAGPRAEIHGSKEPPIAAPPSPYGTSRHALLASESSRSTPLPSYRPRLGRASDLPPSRLPPTPEQYLFNISRAFKRGRVMHTSQITLTTGWVPPGSGNSP